MPVARCVDWGTSGSVVDVAVLTMRRLLILAALAVAAPLAACGGNALTPGSGAVSTPASSSAGSSSSNCDATCQQIRSEEASETPEAPPIDDSPSYATPDKTDFTVTLKILSKECFGSAGCNITYRPELAIGVLDGDLDPSITYDVTYVVKGGDSGPVIATLTVTGDQYEQPSQEVISTASQSKKLVATVTDVEPE